MTLQDRLQRLSAFERVPYPVVSLYLDLRPDQHGRDNFQSFLRKELKARSTTYDAQGDRESLGRDLERIGKYLDNELDRASNGVAIFACDAANLFETVQLDAPLESHWLYIGDQPHLYPLARLVSKFPRYAAVLADTNRTRILVIAHGGIEKDDAIAGVKTRRTTQGGWSQARYQRHIENYHLQHVKEVVAALERTIASEGIDRIVVAGDPVVLPLVREQLPKRLAEMVVDEITLATDASEKEAISKTFESLQQADAISDRDRVDAAVGAYRAGGLGIVGPDATLLALTNGQVDELLITSTLGNLGRLRETPATQMAMANDSAVMEPAVEESAAGEPASADMGTVRLSDELITKAQQTGARVQFIEDPSLLAPYGGVAATLRYRI
jgi:peptide chain release factor subunit 1